MFKGVSHATLIICFAATIISAQLPKASDYFPLQVGNVWEYDHPYQTMFQLFEVVSDTLIEDSVLVYKIDRKSMFSDGIWVTGAPYYYHYNPDSTVIYSDDIIAPQTRYTGLPIIETGYGIGHRTQYLIGDCYCTFAVTDTGSVLVYGRHLPWLEFNTINAEIDSIVIDPTFHWRYVAGIGPTEIGNDTLVYAKINGVEYGTPMSVKVEHTARFYYPAADSIARSLLADPCLIKIRNENVDLFGGADSWDYAYQNLKISFNADTTIIDTTYGEWTGSSCVTNGWFDSDSAILIAEQNGGAQFHQFYPNSKIILDLGSDSGSPWWTEWQIQYCSKSDSNRKLIIGVNALTGEILYNYTTSVNERRTNLSYFLYQNYPNPFNSSTTLRYEMKKPAFINLSIYDVIGRLIKDLINEFEEEGHYTIQWDGSDENNKIVTSGIYFAKLIINNQVFDTQKMILVKQ